MKYRTKRNRPVGGRKVAASIASENLNRGLTAGHKAMAKADLKTAARLLGCGVDALGTSGQTAAVNRALRISLAPDWPDRASSRLEAEALA